LVCERVGVPTDFIPPVFCGTSHSIAHTIVHHSTLTLEVQATPTASLRSSKQPRDGDACDQHVPAFVTDPDPIGRASSIRWMLSILLKDGRSSIQAVIGDASLGVKGCIFVTGHNKTDPKIHDVSVPPMISRR
jgi:hypothetical protein